MTTPAPTTPAPTDIDGRLRSLELSNARQETEFRAMRSKMDEVHKALVNGGNGLVVRVDRIEQAEKRRAKLVSTAVGAAIAAVVGSVWTFVRTGGMR